MAKRTIYLTDDLDNRVRAGIAAGQLDASDVCQRALGHALNGQAPELHQAPEVDHQCAAAAGEASQRLGRIERRLDQIEQHGKRVVSELHLLVLILGSIAAVACVRALATS